MGLSAGLEYDAAAMPDEYDVPFSLVQPFRILCQRQSGLTMHLRGSSFTFPPGTDERHLRGIWELIEVLNSGEVLTVNLATHITRTLHVDAVAYLVGMLATRHVIKAHGSDSPV
jgi:hypothetical protein